MPQRQQILWSQLKVGILVIVSLTLLGIGIFLITGDSGIFTKKMIVRTMAPDAVGLRGGAPVRLAGVDAGVVRDVRISGSPDPATAVEITMQINRRYESYLRADSEAQFATEGPLGERYVNISRGTPTAAAIPPGGTVSFHATAEFSELVGGSRDLIDNLNLLTTRLNSIIGKIDAGEGTIGKLVSDETLYRRLDTSVNDVSKLVADLAGGKGSLGRLLASDEIYDHINATAAKLESIADEIDKSNGTFQKLVHDPSLYDKADQLIGRGTALVDNINQGRGTLGKLVQDDELYRRLNSAVTGVDSLIGNLQKGEGTAGRLLHDPALYDNLNSTSTEVRSLLADFRHNPKKFLTIYFKIF